MRHMKQGARVGDHHTRPQLTPAPHVGGPSWGRERRPCCWNTSRAASSLIKQMSGWVGLSSDHKTDDVVAVTTVDPPTSPVVTSSP